MEISTLRKFWGYCIFILYLVCGGFFLFSYLLFGFGRYSLHGESIDHIERFASNQLIISYFLTLTIILLETYKKIASKPLVYLLFFGIQLPFLVYIFYLLYQFPFVDRTYGFITQSGLAYGERNPLFLSISIWILLVLYLNIRVKPKPFQHYITLLLIFGLLLLRYIFASSHYVPFNG